jgi:hypothetical protein
MDAVAADIAELGLCAGLRQEVQAVTDARNSSRRWRRMAPSGRRIHLLLRHANHEAGLDWMRPKMAAECAASLSLLADNQPLFAGMDASAYTTDGIHPTGSSRQIAKQAWDIMVANCIAQ